jgi:PAS domain S-box-containing protein
MEEKLRQYSEQLEGLVQKRTEELLESEKRYSVLVEEAGDGVIILQDGKVVFANKKATEVIGYSRDELKGLPLEKLVDEKYLPLAKKMYERNLRGDVPITFEVEWRAKNGERIPIEVSGARIYHEGRPAVLRVARDIRERKRMEEQRLKLEKLATMGELATMVAHDLRNPLTSIRNAGYYIKNTCPYRTNTECKTTLEMLNIIEQETIFANNIINDLLDFAAKRPLQKKKQNINEIIEDSLTKGNIPRNIEVKRNFAKKATATLDEKQLERVFLNLIKNAVQAMPDGGKLAVTTKETKDNVEIIFADTGIGISEENMSKIFQPLFTTKAKGIGMGLPICKNIVEQHNGTIEVKSKAGQGTTFLIKLPKKEETKNQ